MVYINNQRYLERTTHGGKRNGNGKGTVRNWWLLKLNNKTGSSSLNIGSIHYPSHWVGKRIRLKVEVLEDDEK